MSQLQDNLGALKVELTDSEMKQLDEMTAPPVQYPNWFSERTIDATHKEAISL